MERLEIDPIKTRVAIDKVEKGARALLDGLVDESKRDLPQHRFQFEREVQIQSFIAHAGIYAQDLRRWYELRRLDLLSQTIRCLMELDVWSEFCNVSEANWKGFVDDASRDMRELAQVVLKMDGPGKQEIYSQVASDFAKLHKEAVQFGISDFDKRYTSDRDAAKEIGRGEEYGGRYKFYSKYAHPSALWFVLIEPIPSYIFDGAYAEGTRLAVMCLRQCEKSVAEKYPELVRDEESK